ncbi:gliding motility protein GldN [Sinomicrobium kalidii]|uniref:type IX secretion system ring protein PorN/GldN n=1 Tax=Sinomicrobium kalidii TaxID=2900738 RepID=UPI001E47E5B3|nr:gliding motility protein GldN [Sinomicrobium kalidii]UGU17324.1 gliding motility protein GldN [Sinomicrobium kalidii]
MCWKGVLLTVTVAFMWINVNGQANILNAEKPEDIGKLTEAQAQADPNKPLEYGYVEDRDILWSKMTWEVIDLNERVNFPLYYPIDGQGAHVGRQSLYDVLVTNIKNGRIQDIYADSYFTEKRRFGELEATLTKVDTTDLGLEQVNAGEQVSEMYIDRRDLSAADIVEYHIKGMWYFDKRQGELKYRLLGIAPVAPDINFMDQGITDGSNLVELFWVWYPSARQVLHEAKAFNLGNSGVPISFDHLLNARRFNAVIYKEENVYGDREISDYIPDNAMFQLMEAKRIKEEIRNFEQDVWKNE